MQSKIALLYKDEQDFDDHSIDPKSHILVTRKYIANAGLISRNITVNGSRTTIRLEEHMWDALKEISRREGRSIHDLCSFIYNQKPPETSLTASIRVFLMLYFRSASTEEGHRSAGHGGI